MEMVEFRIPQDLQKKESMYFLNVLYMYLSNADFCQVVSVYF